MKIITENFCRPIKKLRYHRCHRYGHLWCIQSDDQCEINLVMRRACQYRNDPFQQSAEIKISLDNKR